MTDTIILSAPHPSFNMNQLEESLSRLSQVFTERNSKGRDDSAYGSLENSLVDLPKAENEESTNYVQLPPIRHPTPLSLSELDRNLSNISASHDTREPGGGFKTSPGGVSECQSPLSDSGVRSSGTSPPAANDSALSPTANSSGAEAPKTYRTARFNEVFDGLSEAEYWNSMKELCNIVPETPFLSGIRSVDSIDELENRAGLESAQPLSGYTRILDTPQSVLSLESTDQDQYSDPAIDLLHAQSRQGLISTFYSWRNRSMTSLRNLSNAFGSLYQRAIDLRSHFPSWRKTRPSFSHNVDSGRIVQSIYPSIDSTGNPHLAEVNPSESFGVLPDGKEEDETTCFLPDCAVCQSIDARTAVTPESITPSSNCTALPSNEEELSSTTTFKAPDALTTIRGGNSSQNTPLSQSQTNNQEQEDRSFNMKGSLKGAEEEKPDEVNPEVVAAYSLCSMY